MPGTLRNMGVSIFFRFFVEKHGCLDFFDFFRRFFSIFCEEGEQYDLRLGAVHRWFSSCYYITHEKHKNRSRLIKYLIVENQKLFNYLVCSMTWAVLLAVMIVWSAWDKQRTPINSY